MRGKILYNFHTRKLTLVIDPLGPCSYTTWTIVASLGELNERVKDLLLKAIEKLETKENCSEIVEKLKNFAGVGNE